MNLLKAEEIALELFKKHNITNWNFKFDRAKKRFGCCNFNRKTISLSNHLTKLNKKEIVLDTILHEIAHALVGPFQRHNEKWKAKAKEIGGSGIIRFSSKDTILPKSKYIAKCPNCKKEFPSNRKTKSACKQCCITHNKGKFSKKFMIEYRERG